ncbi:acetolactate synthase 2 small subunit [Moritella marina ATCC 15381]|uniref:Acetolactate synthase 2 small subunit n=1 Tax=Moritella marina ATCC 15381 TaxID=1202962 RepID=A0A5J6WST9_MORMI|nr:acetolactate synthase 2 small subunit [Moritella marina]QFI40328.1 acetolactate synthase 2 small subunit [Moritella marina ATCC 15381]
MSVKKVHEVVIEASNTLEILERVLRVIRHRGFRVSTMNSVQMNDCNSIKITVTVSGERGIDLLYKQLDKLFDVNKLSYQQITA